MSTRSVSTVVKFVDILEQYYALKESIDHTIQLVITESAFIGGVDLDDFERWFAEYCGVEKAVGISSGSAAVELVLRALGIGRGDEVITAANTFIATAAAMSATGARPVFVDVLERTGNLDPERLSQAITSRVKAIVPVHLYGRPAAMHEVLSLADRLAWHRGLFQLLSHEKSRRVRRWRNGDDK